MPTHNDIFHYFENKFFELSKKYEFRYLYIEPCAIRSKNDLTEFIEQLQVLFADEQFDIVDELNDELNDNLNEVKRVNFIFNNQPMCPLK